MPPKSRPLVRPGLLSAALCLIGLLAPTPSHAGAFGDIFIDPVDGQFDTTAWLTQKRGFLPIPIIITEPALGYGGGAALMFLHGKHKGTEVSENNQQRPPSNISAVMGFATETSTWAAGAYHFGSFLKDRIRYIGMGGYTSANLTFYPLDRPVDMNLTGFLIHQEVQFRIARTNLFLGGRYRYSKLDSTLEGGPPLLPDSIENAIGGLGLLAHWDGRDNIFTPNDGQDVLLVADFNNPGFGADQTWWLLEYKVHSFHTVHPRVVVGLRLDGDLSWGDTPFYALPYVKLRGIPALRYQGEKAGEGEIDIRWRVYKRWSLVGFVGLGWTAQSVTGDNGPFPAGGGGFRYLLARELGMQVGIDVATSQTDTAFYIQVGSAW